MATASRLQLVTPLEYLAFERRAESKHEYRDGSIVAMPGASMVHNAITMNLGRVIGNQLQHRPCFVFSNDLRACVDPDGFYTYPDLVVVCGEPQTLDDEFDNLLNPTLIVEILSPSTESYDRGEKFARFRGIASLREYVLVSQDRVRVERHTLVDGVWIRFEWSGLGDVARFDSINCEVPLAAIYDKVPQLRRP